MLKQIRRCRSSRALGMLCAFAALCLMGIAPAHAQQKTDFLKAEGAPVSVANYLERGLRKHVAAQKQFSLLANPMAPGMAQLTLGCTLDSAACVARLAKMRSAKVVFHLRVLPFGSRAKAVFRKLDGTTGKTLKSVSYRFRRRQLKKALGILKTRMFGGGAPVARRAAPVARRAAVVVARRAAPVARRAAPVARRAAVVARRAAPVARRAAAVVARRAAPVARRAVAAVRRAAPPVVRRAVVAVRRAAPPVARRVAPVVRRAVVTARPSVPAVRRPAVVARKIMPRRAPAVLVRRPAPVRRPNVRTTKRTVATARVAPKPTPSVPLVKRPSFWAWICVGVTVAAIGGTIAFGLDAQSKEGEVNQLIERSKQGEQVRYTQDVQPLENSGKTSAVMANVFIGIGAATAATAVILFLLPKPKPKAPSTAQLPTGNKPTMANFKNFTTQF